MKLIINYSEDIIILVKNKGLTLSDRHVILKL